MLQLWTMQIGQWRRARDQGIQMLDITVKSGLHVFAPEPSVLWAYKRGETSWDEYVVAFEAKMRQSIIDYPKHWDTFAKKERVALACYCAAGENCHRHLLVPLITHHLAQFPVEVAFHGELK
jgi:uncharacterized protein YeaO (DUF488 family)